ncbi:hypothetical protein IV203_012181 [Nitzschia inconspicua]|uniref:Uncharacterized protein n=1 Tax=Nitzschia inconspicua TaxID=303405 RepID=A0A9K3KUJ5_9STRA|nr:hypothetical protein IV203_012181 [Nitzschia inconspicua]
MYGLPQATRISNDYLRTFLEPAGYHPTEHTPGLWRQRIRALASSLVVDDFAVKYVDLAVVDHLLTTLRQRYKYKADWDGTRCCNLTHGITKPVHVTSPCPAGYHYLSETNDNPAIPATPNGAIHIACQTLGEVVSSATEAELAGTLHCKKHIPSTFASKNSATLRGQRLSPTIASLSELPTIS